MTILLTGGGTGGHITPLLAVARELKQLDPSVRLVGVCEKNAKFVDLFEREPAVDEVRQVRAGKFRRYSGLKLHQKVLDIKTMGLNVRDSGYVLAGIRQATKLMKEIKPDGVLIKGGFVGVPVGIAAARLKIPIITHDSDSTPGLANRIVSRWAAKHATGMPAELYAYPKEKTVYTGIPLSEHFQLVTPEMRTAYREHLRLNDCKQVVAVIGGSQGAKQLNEDFLRVAGRLMHDYPHLGIAHVAGREHEKAIRRGYDGELLADEQRRVIVTGFTDELYAYSGAADIVVTRAGATNTAEFALQGLPLIMVPGQLAGGHQDKNAQYYQDEQAAITVSYGDSEGLHTALKRLLDSEELRRSLAEHLRTFAKPHAAKELAELTYKTFKG